MDENDHHLLDLLDLGLCLARKMDIFLTFVLSWMFKQIMYYLSFAHISGHKTRNEGARGAVDYVLESNSR